MNESNEIRDYLLGSLPPEYIEQIEQRILTDDAFHEEVEIMEEELLDRYAQGKMFGEERLLFERHFLNSPLRKQKLAFARAFQARVNSVNDAPNLIPGRFLTLYPYAFAVSALALVALGFLSYRLSTQLQQQRNQTALLIRQIEEMHKSPIAVSYPDLASQPLLVQRLRPGVSRGEKLPTISIPDGIRAVQFALQAPKALQGEVSVELLNDSGQSIITLHQIHPQRVGNDHLVIATLTREYLGTGNYFLRVTSLQSPSTQLRYAFQVGR